LPSLPFDEQFVLTGPASKETRRIVIWWNRSDRLPATSCGKITNDPRIRGQSVVDIAPTIKQLRDRRAANDSVKVRRDSAASAAGRGNEDIDFLLGDPLLRVSDWSRQDTLVTQFALLSGPLDANVDYTFCTQTVRKLTAAETQSFRGEIAAGIGRVLGSVLKEDGDAITRDRLHEIQSALSAAVPHRDLVSYSGQDALLQPRDFKKEKPEETTRRDTLLNVRVAALEQLVGRRMGRITAITIRTKASLIRLQRVIADPGFRKLPELYRALSLMEDRLRFMDAGKLALSLQNATEAELTRVTLGATPLQRLDAGAADVDFKSFTDASQLSDATANLQATSDGLKSLRDLAEIAKRDSSALKKGGSRIDELNTLTTWIDTAASHIAAQRLNVATLGEALGNIKTAASELAATVIALDLNDIGLNGSSATTYEENSRRYVSADIGIMYAFGANATVGSTGKQFIGGASSPYIGASFFFRPVNKHYPLAQCPGPCISRRLSLTVGVTTNSIKRTGIRDDLFANQTVIVAVGWRMTDYFRATLGGLVFKSIDPATSGERVTVTPVGALSLDWDIRASLGPIFGKLFPGT
jgi:hypothetical protein